MRDAGTREFQAKRHFLINGSPAELAGSAAGILLANQHLAERQYHAALTYRRLYCMLFGKPFEGMGSRLERFQPWQAPQIVLDDDAGHALERKLRRLNSELADEQRDAIVDTCVLDYLPSWFACAKQRVPAPACEVARRDALLSGLTALADALGYSDKRDR
jgi:hypothetical protein